MTIQKTSKTSVCFFLEGACGTIFHGLHATVAEAIVSKAFSVVAAPTQQPAASCPRVPSSASQLPDPIAVQLMGFMQHRLRAHVLTAAAGPPGTLHLLRVNDTRVEFLKQSATVRPTMRVTARLHTSSADCFCRAHHLAPPEERMKGSFTGKRTATIRFDMCGEKLTQDGNCPTHGGGCSTNEFVPGVCCCNLSVSMGCMHERRISDECCKPAGTWFPIELKDSFERTELSAFLSCASEWHRRATRVFEGDDSKRSRRLAGLVQLTESLLDQRVEKIDRFLLTNPQRVSDDDLEVRDLVAVEALREGGWVQAKPATKGNRAQKLIHAPTGRETSKEQKKLHDRHMWLFPRHNAPHGVQSAETTETTESTDSTETAESTETAVPADTPEAPTAKRQCVESRDREYQELTEYLDVEGMQTMRAQINELLKTDLPQKQRERGLMFLQFIDALERESGEEEEGPLGYRVKPLICKYSNRNDGGRLYATGGATLQEFGGGYAYSCCIQGVPREIRPFLCCRWSHDYDLANAQPEILKQLIKLLTWTDGRDPPELPRMDEWCANRKDFIQRVADLHKLPTDDQKWEDYRKDMVKRCVISLMFGGKYATWRKELCRDLGRRFDDEPVCEKLVEMESELAELRKATFESREHGEFYERDYKRLRKEGRKLDADGEIDIEAINRGIFARIAQREEDRVLTIMRAFMHKWGFIVLSLCFDGLMVKHRRDKAPDLHKLNEEIYEKTKVQKRDKQGQPYWVGYRLRVEEKQMFSADFPRVSLSRV